MNKTIFDGYELILTEGFGETYAEKLDKKGIKYEITDLGIDHTTIFDLGISSFTTNEIVYQNDKNETIYVYSFEVVFIDDLQCISFISIDRQLPKKIVDKLGIAYRENKLELIPYFPNRKKFPGFKIDKDNPTYIPLNDLVGTFLVDKNGYRYEFNEFKWFPEGAYGKKIYERFDSDYNSVKEEVDIMIFAKAHNNEILFFLDESGKGWKIVGKDMFENLLSE